MRNGHRFAPERLGFFEAFTQDKGGPIVVGCIYRRSVEPCLAELIDGLKLKPAQAESLEQLLDEHEVHDLETAQILDAEDFKEIGIKVGTRKKLLERLASSTSEA